MSNVMRPAVQLHDIGRFEGRMDTQFRDRVFNTVHKLLIFNGIILAKMLHDVIFPRDEALALN